MDTLFICRQIRTLEWVVIGIVTLCQWLFLSESHTADKLFNLSYLVLFMAMAVASYVPWRHGNYGRLAVLSAQALLYTIALAIGAYRLYGLLFFLLAGKASLQLTKKTTAVFVTILSVLHITGVYVALELYRTGVHIMPRTEGHGMTGLFFFESQLFFLSSIVIVALFGRTFLAEQQSRRAAEHLFKEVESMAVAVERSRIARDIHDSLGHSLTSLNIQLELSAKHLDESEVDKAKQSLATARQIAGGSLKDVRRAVQSIKDDDFSLSEAINALVDRITEQQPIGIEVSIDDQPLSTSSRHNLLLLVKECLTNIQRHAGASQVQISLLTDNGKAELTVRDNGKGFVFTDATSGFGIKGMRDRVTSLGGTLNIETEPEKGTCIMISVPT